MTVHSPRHDPNFCTGEAETTVDSVVASEIFVETPLTRGIRHVGVTLKGSTGIGDEFVPKWDIPDASRPHEVRVRFYKAAGTGADTAVTFSFVAYGAEAP